MRLALSPVRPQPVAQAGLEHAHGVRIGGDNVRIGVAVAPTLEQKVPSKCLKLFVCPKNRFAFFCPFDV
jgi:hypothetical protein